MSLYCEIGGRKTEPSMRYKETGDVHLDFHRTMNGTISYLRQRYGIEVLDEILRRTAQDVYREIRADLMEGNPEHLLEHWTYFLTREGGQFTVERTDDEIRVTVLRCPAAAYLRERGIPLDPEFRRQTTVLNEALGAGTPFEVTTEVIDDLRYIQAIRKRQP
jgi:hypothetical protein